MAFGTFQYAFLRIFLAFPNIGLSVAQYRERYVDQLKLLHHDQYHHIPMQDHMIGQA